MGKAKSRTRIERGLVEIDRSQEEQTDGGQQTRVEVWPPELDEGHEEQTVVLDLSDRDQLILRYVSNATGQLVEFALVQQARMYSDRWHDVMRLDMAHGVLHIHEFTLSGDESSRDILPIDECSSVDDAYNEAYMMALQDWDDQRRRWRCDA